MAFKFYIVDPDQGEVFGTARASPKKQRWTNKRFTVAAITIDRTNAEARSKGKVFMDRVELKD